MIKRTLYFGTPSYLKTKDEQLVFESAEYWRVKNFTYRRYWSTNFG
jgi:hypothetical protein